MSLSRKIPSYFPIVPRIHFFPKDSRSRPVPFPLLVILSVPRSTLITSKPVLPDRNLDALRGEALAQVRAFDDPRELFR